MKKNYFLLANTMFILSIIIAFFIILNYFKGIIEIANIFNMFLLILVCVLVYFGCLFLSRYKNDKSVMKKGLLVYFIIYVFSVILLTMIDRGLFSYAPILYAFEDIRDCFDSSNFVPFRETILFIKENIIDGTYYRLALVLGNFLVLMPMAYFLPRLFKRQKKYLIFCITVILFTLGIELGQVFTLTGTFDIDDIILNSLGAILMFIPFNKLFLGRVFDKIILFSDEEIIRKDIYKSIISILSIVCLFGVAIYFYYIDDPGIEVNVIDESISCEGEKELIYEDRFYRYYFPCNKSDKVFIVFDKKYKYSIKDYLNGNNIKTKYKNRFDVEKLNYVFKLFIIESKGYDISVLVENGFIFSPKVDDDILILRGKSSSSDEFGNDTYVFLIEPKEKGETYISFEIKNRDTSEIIRIEKYKVIINEDLSIKYEKIEE